MARRRKSKADRDRRDINEILPELLKRLGVSTGRNRDLQELWLEIAGEELARCTRVASLRGGRLTVEVANASVMQELSVYHKSDFLKLLRQRSRSPISELRFKLSGPLRDPFDDESSARRQRPTD